jgi:hypothetical protein
MSEYHTQQLRLAEYETLYSDALDRNHEQQRLINRIDQQNEATNEQIINLEAAYERQNNQFNQVTNQLQSNLKHQEQRYQEEIKATRKEHVKNLQNVASNFKTQIGDFKNQVANQFATERKNTKAMVDKVQQESKKMINGVRNELSNKLKEQDQKINKIDIKVDNLKSDVDKLKDQDQNAALLAKNYYDDIKFLIEQEEKSDISLFKKQSYWKDNNSPLADLRQRLEIIKGQMDSNNNQIAASASLELYLQYDSHRKHINISHQHILEQYRAFLSEYKSLLNAAENSQKVKINGINPTNLSYDINTKKWNDESQEIEIDVDFWTGGKLKVFIDKHKPQYEKLNTPERERNTQIDEKFIENLREKILGEEKSAQSEYEAIVKEAKELALTSNLREVLAEKALKRLEDKYKGSLVCNANDKGFELGDPKNNFHLRFKISGVERHLILGNSKDTKTITRTIMEGNDNTGDNDAFKIALEEQIDVMNESGLKLETNGEAIQNHSSACTSAENFISKGMSEENKQSVGIIN